MLDLRRVALRVTIIAAAALLGTGLLALGQAGASAQPSIDPFAQVARLGRGVNILSDDPLWDDPGKARFKPTFYALIRAGGFATVRINLKAFSHMDGSDRLDERWLATLDDVVARCLAAQLKVILDEHDFGACSADPTGCLPKLTAFWRQIATRYRSSPDTVLFELENEPHDPLTPALWNAMLRSVLAVVRDSNPTRTVVIGPGSYNDWHDLQALELPEQDRNILVTVHYYAPMTFTHQGAPWNPATTALSNIPWGNESDRAQLDRDIEAIAAWAREHRRPILLGEFGAYDRAPLDSRVRYDAAVARAAERQGWAWCYWQFDSDFVVFDVTQDRWVEPIWHALVPRTP